MSTDVTSFFKELVGATGKQQARLLKKMPLPEIHDAALRNPDPFVRRDLLGFLDHYANDESMAVFAKALRDPVDFVRNIALHSLACEACKDDDVCPADVIPGLLHVIQWDDNPELRMKAIPLLLRLAPTDARARTAVERCAAGDSDAIVRKAATEALAGRLIQPRKRYEREQRRHARRPPPVA